VLSANLAPQVLYVDLEQAPDMDRQLLVERHLISKPHATADGARGVAIGENETLSIMVNEGRPPAHPGPAQRAPARRGVGPDQQDRRCAGAKLDFAFHPRFGYLTPARPTSAPASA
jgi:protein arginine kinase